MDGSVWKKVCKGDDSLGSAWGGERRERGLFSGVPGSFILFQDVGFFLDVGRSVVEVEDEWCGCWLDRPGRRSRGCCGSRECKVGTEYIQKEDVTSRDESSVLAGEVLHD